MNCSDLARKILARERKYAEIIPKPKPVPITAFWHDGGYNGAYQLFIPSQPEIALVTKSTTPMEPELLRELRRQDPGRLELNVDPEFDFSALPPIYRMRLVLSERKLGPLTGAQEAFAADFL